MSDSPTFQIPKEVIEPIIQAHVTTAVINALGGQGRLVEQAIAMVLTRKVGSDGTDSRYNSSTDPTFLTWALQNAIRNAVQRALQEEVAKHEEQIRKMLAAELHKSKSPLVMQLVEGMTKGIVEATKSQWQIKVHYGRE